MTTKEQAQEMLERAETCDSTDQDSVTIFGDWALSDLPELARSYIALQSRVEALEGALKPFARNEWRLQQDQEEWLVVRRVVDGSHGHFKAKHISAAHAALHPEPAAEPSSSRE